MDPRIEAIQVQYDLDRNDFWELPQRRGTWIAKHSALETVAVKANISFSMPEIIEANGADGVAAMVVQGVMGDRVEWATGEAAPKNNKNAYPWAMAEKRAKDRVVLKLAGLHGLVYSEEEGDFTQPKAKTRDLFESLSNDIKHCETLQDLANWWSDAEVQACIKSLKTDWQDEIIEQKDNMKTALEQRTLANTP